MIRLFDFFSVFGLSIDRSVFTIKSLIGILVGSLMAWLFPALSLFGKLFTGSRSSSSSWSANGERRGGGLFELAEEIIAVAKRKREVAIGSVFIKHCLKLKLL